MKTLLLAAVLAVCPCVALAETATDLPRNPYPWAPPDLLIDMPAILRALPPQTTQPERILPSFTGPTSPYGLYGQPTKSDVLNLLRNRVRDSVDEAFPDYGYVAFRGVELLGGVAYTAHRFANGRELGIRIRPTDDTRLRVASTKNGDAKLTFDWELDRQTQSRLTVEAHRHHQNGYGVSVRYRLTLD